MPKLFPSHLENNFGTSNIYVIVYKLIVNLVESVGRSQTLRDYLARSIETFIYHNRIYILASAIYAEGRGDVGGHPLSCGCGSGVALRETANLKLYSQHMGSNPIIRAIRSVSQAVLRRLA